MRAGGVGCEGMEGGRAVDEKERTERGREGDKKTKQKKKLNKVVLPSSRSTLVEFFITGELYPPQISLPWLQFEDRNLLDWSQ